MKKINNKRFLTILFMVVLMMSGIGQTVRAAVKEENTMRTESVTDLALPTDISSWEDLKSALTSADENTVINLSAAITVPADAALDGKGATVISAANARHFVTNGVFTISDVTLDGNNVSGGIEAAPGSVLSISRTVFENNTAHTGGAIHITNGTATISQSSFKKNKATGGGGAITCDNRDVVLSLDNCEFLENTATGGGAISLLNAKKLTIKNNTTFTSNTATYFNGGAINVYAAIAEGPTIIDISDAAFTGNSADSIDGGAIYIDTAKSVTISGTEFNDNQCGQNGGALYIVGEVPSATVSGCNFIGNRAGSGSWCYGGAINFYMYTNAKATVENSNFIENSACNAGAIRLNNHLGTNVEFKVSGSTFEGNEATALGGALCLSDSDPDAAGHSDLKLSNNVFQKNKAVSGGALHAQTYMSSQDIDITECTFNENAASNYGGAVYLIDARKKGCNVMINSGSFTDNTALLGGAFMQFQNTTVQINDGDFWNNKATAYGGTACLYYATSLKVLNGTFEKNTAVLDGGAIYLYDYAGYNALEILGGTYKDNYAERDGGAIHVGGTAESAYEKLTVDMVSGEFIGNVAGHGPYPLDSVAKDASYDGFIDVYNTYIKNRGPQTSIPKREYIYNNFDVNFITDVPLEAYAVKTEVKNKEGGYVTKIAADGVDKVSGVEMFELATEDRAIYSQQEVTVSAQPQSGYTFVGWVVQDYEGKRYSTEDLGITDNDLKSLDLKLKMPENNVYAIAEFKEEPKEEATEAPTEEATEAPTEEVTEAPREAYSVKTAVRYNEGGYVTQIVVDGEVRASGDNVFELATEDKSVYSQQEVTVSARAESGYTFVGWKVQDYEGKGYSTEDLGIADNDLKSLDVKLKMPANNVSAIAVFKADTKVNPKKDPKKADTVKKAVTKPSKPGIISRLIAVSTGDATNVIFYSVSLMGALLAIVVIVKRKKNRE